MQKTIRFVRKSALVVTGLVVAAVWVEARAATVLFQGLTHTAVGGAVLRHDTAGDTLAVATFDPAGGDGVAVGLPKTSSWAARLQVVDRGLPLKLSFDALADARRISTAAISRTAGVSEFSAVFTGSTRPTYTAAVYRGGQLVGAVGSLPPAARVYVPPSPCDIPEFRPFFICGNLVSRFHNTADGECIWAFVFDRTQSFRLPNGAVLTGNELRLIEEVSAPGHYPYTSFDGMVVRTNGDLTLQTESVR